MTEKDKNTDEILFQMAVDIEYAVALQTAIASMTGLDDDVLTEDDLLNYRMKHGEAVTLNHLMRDKVIEVQKRLDKLHARDVQAD